MKTKTIDRLIEICYKPNVDMSLVIDYLRKEKQRKEQKKKQQTFFEITMDCVKTVKNMQDLIIRSQPIPKFEKGGKEIQRFEASKVKEAAKDLYIKMLEELKTEDKKEIDYLKKQNKDLYHQLEHNKICQFDMKCKKEPPKPSIVDCISVMIQQVKNSDYKPNIIQFIEDEMIIEMQITDNKVILKRKN